jgi:type I restriction enzyme M protein
MKIYSRIYPAKISDEAPITSYRIGKEKYEWLFKDDTNYSWYRPSKSVLIDLLYEFGQYDFSELDRDILGTIYEHYLDRQDRKNKGQYYTPLEVVDFIWDRVGFKDDNSFFNWKNGNRLAKLIYDCASGSGSFLVEAARRIRVKV